MNWKTQAAYLFSQIHFYNEKRGPGTEKKNHIGQCKQCSKKPCTSSAALCEAIAKWLTCGNNFSQNKLKVYSGFSARTWLRLSSKTRDQQSTSSVAQARSLSSMFSLATKKTWWGRNYLVWGHNALEPESWKESLSWLTPYLDSLKCFQILNEGIAHLFNSSYFF